LADGLAGGLTRISGWSRGLRYYHRRRDVGSHRHLLARSKRDYAAMRTQMDGVHIAINSLAVSLADLRATVSPLTSGLNKMHENIDKLHVDVDAVSGNVARIAKFLGHLAGTPPSFPSDLPK
jgi:hypothetical protein